MSYSTHAYPDYRSLSPKVETAGDVSEYALTTARALKDIFGERQEIDRPEYDAVGYAKRAAVYTALVLDARTENQTLGEFAALISNRVAEIAEEKADPSLEITPQVLAVAAYAETVRNLDWGVSQLDEWDTDALVIVHDSIHDFTVEGKEVLEA